MTETLTHEGSWTDRQDERTEEGAKERKSRENGRRERGREGRTASGQLCRPGPSAGTEGRLPTPKNLPAEKGRGALESGAQWPPRRRRA